MATATSPLLGLNATEVGWLPVGNGENGAGTSDPPDETPNTATLLPPVSAVATSAPLELNAIDCGLVPVPNSGFRGVKPGCAAAA